MRRGAAWLLTLPLAVGGSQLAHAEAYALVYADPHERTHALATSGHAYLAYAPLAAALGIGLVLVGLVAYAGGQRSRLAFWPFATLPIVVFLLQETIERGGGLSVVAEPTLLVGLLLQLPFAALAYAAARLLLQAVDAFLAAIRPAATHHLLASLRRPADVRLAPLPRLAFGLAQRGPPRSR